MIVADKISKYYGSFAAISELSFSIGRNEVIGLLGLNGAGKTTTLRILSGLLVPSSGSIQVDGIDMATDPELVRSRIGFLPETPPLYPDMTVEGYLKFVARINGCHGDLDDAITAAIEAVEIADRRSARIGTLSHGYQRRVGIAHAIVHDPALILLDEPTSGLDPVQIVQMRERIRALKQRHTVIVSSHILSEMHQMCDRIFVLHEGKVVAEGTEDELAAGLSGATTIDLEVRASRSQLQSALANVVGVTSHEVTREVEGILEVVVQLDSDNREALAEALVGAGVALRRLDHSNLGLESIFLQLTGGNGSPRRTSHG